MSTSTKATGSLVLHAVSALIMGWAYNALETTVLHTFIQHQKGGHLQFLTIQSMAVSWLTMLLSLFCDLLPTSQPLKQTKRAFFMIALPLSVVVTSIYWSLMLFLPSLILQPVPGSSEPSSSSAAPTPDFVRIPLSLDLALHAVPAAALLVDFFAFEDSYGVRAARHGATAMAFAFGVWYSVWVEYCASHNGTFPYPFLTVNPLPIRIVIYGAVTTIAFLSFRGINAVHSRVTGRSPRIKSQ
ncbi:FAR-17a/AIG1-like protein [Phellopilus nigrolimitatus]|nr:FAR-17a/AIG1-like protein [Phellopilus nigrolimitatus]